MVVFHFPELLPYKTVDEAFKGEYKTITSCPNGCNRFLKEETKMLKIK